MSLEEIYMNAGLSPEEVGKMPRYLDGILDFYDSSAYNKLYEYFAFDGPIRMPYGTAKARDGDPDVWILEYLENINTEGGISV